MQKLRISPEAAFSVNDWTAFVIFIVVIGGIGRMEGPLIGTIVFFLLRGFLADFGPWYFMLLGAVAIIVTLLSIHGSTGSWRCIMARRSARLLDHNLWPSAVQQPLRR